MLREKVREWLGLHTTDMQVSSIMTSISNGAATSDSQVRAHVVDALAEVLKERSGIYAWDNELDPHRRQLVRLINNAICEQAESAATTRVEARIGGEAFIDEVIERINRKQIKGD